MKYEIFLEGFIVYNRTRELISASLPSLRDAYNSEAYFKPNQVAIAPCQALCCHHAEMFWSQGLLYHHSLA